MRILFQRIGRIFEYLMAILFVGIFTLYCSGRVGWFLIIVLILAPILSMGYAGISAKYLGVTGDVSGDIFSKGDHLFIRLRIHNRSILPSAFLQIDLIENKHWQSEKRRIVTAISPKTEDCVQIKYQAQYAGGSEIGIEKISVCDYFGFLSIPLMEKGQPLRWSVGVVPDLEPSVGAEEFLHEALQDVGVGNESEESIEASADTFGGFPGYEYRQYRPGDPIKRINYKLSAKKEELWVRLDEKQAIATVNLMLDPYYTRECYDAIEIQHVLEVSLGVIQSLLLREFVVEVWIRSKEIGNLERHVVSEEEHLFLLARELAKYQFKNIRQPMLLPEAVGQGEVVIIYVTPHDDRELLTEIEQIKKDKAVSFHMYCTDEGGDITC